MNLRVWLRSVQIFNAISSSSFSGLRNCAQLSSTTHRYLCTLFTTLSRPLEGQLEKAKSEKSLRPSPQILSLLFIQVLIFTMN